jgi:hypothetical protein
MGKITIRRMLDGLLLIVAGGVLLGCMAAWGEGLLGQHVCRRLAGHVQPAAESRGDF